CEGAALASAVKIGERNRRRTELCCIGAVSIAGDSVTACAILREQGGAPSIIRRLGWRKRDWIGLQEIGCKVVRKVCYLLGRILCATDACRRVAPATNCSRASVGGRAEMRVDTKAANSVISAYSDALLICPSETAP